MAAHLYWRVRGLLNNSNPMACSELQMRATIGGANQCVGGTPMCSSQYSGGYPIASAFDGIGPQDGNEWAASGASPGVEWIGYQFLAPVVVAEIAYSARQGFGSQSPNAAVLEWSDDGSVWTAEFSMSFGAFANGETKVKSRAAAPAPGPNPHTYWRIRHSGFFAAAREVELRQTSGGPNLTDTELLQPIDGGHYADWWAGSAFDDNLGTVYAGDQWMGAQFLNPVTVQEFSWTCRNDGGDNYQVATSGTVDWSDNGTDWTEAWSWVAGAWTAGETKVLSNGALFADVPRAKWRVKMDSVNNTGRHCYAADQIQLYTAPFTAGLVPEQVGYSASLIYGNDGFGAAWQAFNSVTGQLWHNDCSGAASAYVGWDFGAGNEIVVRGFMFMARNGGYGNQDSIATGGLEYYNEVAGAWQRAFSVPPQSGWSDSEKRFFMDPAKRTPDAGGYRFWEIKGTAGGNGYSGLSGVQMAKLGGPDLTSSTFVGSTKAGSFQAGSIASILDSVTDEGMAQWDGVWSSLDKWFAADFGDGERKAIREITIYPNRDDVNRTFTEFDVAVWNNPDRSDRVVLQHFVCDPWVLHTPQTFLLDPYSTAPAARRRQSTMVC